MRLTGFLGTAAWIFALAFFLFALVHAYWALGGQRAAAAAIPQEGGQYVFRPRAWMTWSVAAALLACAGLLLSCSSVAPLTLPRAASRIGVAMLAIVMMLRGVGDFRYMGLFQKVRTGTFARMDRHFYTPLCIVSGVLFMLMALAG